MVWYGLQAISKVWNKDSITVGRNAREKAKAAKNPCTPGSNSREKNCDTVKPSAYQE